MSSVLCKTLIHLRRVLAASASPNPNLRCIQFLSHNYSTGISDSDSDSDSRSFTVSYLIKSCSFSPESALSASKKVSFKTPDKPDSVLSFFKNRGFSDSQISSIVSRYPRFLLSDTNKTFMPKLDFFYLKGVSQAEVAGIVTKTPVILGKSFKKHIVPAFDFLKGFLQSDERTIKCIKRFPSVLAVWRHNPVTVTMRMLFDIGVSKVNVTFFLLHQPRMFAVDINRFREILKDVVKLGFIPAKSTFIQAVFVMQSMSKSTWKHKLDVYKRWGFSEEEVLTAFRRHPWCMTLSEEKIMLAMDLFINKLGWESAAVIKSPILLSFSFKKRLIPRASVLLFLFQKGLTEKEFMLSKPYMCTEHEFLQKFVTPYLEQFPQLTKIYHGVNPNGGLYQHQL